MNLATDPKKDERLASRGKRKPQATKNRTVRILAAVGGSEATGRVIKYLLGLQSLHASFEVILLNVQPEPQDWRLRGYGSFKREAIRDRLVNDLGKPATVSAGRQLDAAGIVHKDRVELGDAADTIIRCAHEEQCDFIVLAETSPGPIRRWLMGSAGVSIGSVASVVIGLAQVPVVIAK